MGHEDIGHFADKHPSGTKPDPAVETAIRKQMADGQLTCAAAHGIAEALSIPPSQIGVAMDLMEVRIAKCQMGLFGYHPRKRIVRAAQTVSARLENDIRASLTGHRISCKRCWELAGSHGLRKIDVAAACESLHIKVNQCQLGAF